MHQHTKDLLRVSIEELDKRIDGMTSSRDIMAGGLIALDDQLAGLRERRDAFAEELRKAEGPALTVIDGGAA